MFKPFKGECKDCGNWRWIVVKAGFCKACNERRKFSSSKRDGWTQDIVATKEDKHNYKKDFKTKKPIQKKASKIQYRKKSTGELALFLEMWQEAIESPTGPVCRCCATPLGFFSVSYFSHLLGKGAYPKFRLFKENIWIKCTECHKLWETKAISDLPIWFSGAIAEKERLKQLYYTKTL
jgi:hypothetical protein